MKLPCILVVFSFFLNTNYIVAQGTIGGGLAQHHKAQRKKKKEEKRNQYMLEDAHQGDNETTYWQVMTPQNIKELTDVPDSLNRGFIIYCNIRIEDKTVPLEYHYSEKIVTLYREFQFKHNQE